MSLPHPGDGPRAIWCRMPAIFVYKEELVLRNPNIVALFCSYTERGSFPKNWGA
jgi:hypothetical protein